MNSRTRLFRGLRLVSAFSVLAAIIACGGGDDDDAPPPPPPQPVVDPNAPPGAIAQFDLGPGFTPDPRRAAGTAGGPFEASTRDPACLGYIGAEPNHTLNLTAPFTNLRLVVNAVGDTTLVVQLSTGQYLCDDDGGEGTNPMIAAAFPAGLHRVFVGTYGRPGPGAAPTSYTLDVTQTPAPARPPSSPPAAGATSLISLNAGFTPDPRVASGIAGGPIQASGFDRRCRGGIPGAPQHTLMLGTDFRNLNISVNSRADTTLVIRGPDGSYRCDDDGGVGSNPRVRGAWGPGTYQVWVGVYGNGGRTERYTIGFSEAQRALRLPLP